MPYFGVYRGTVQDTAQLAGSGRVRVSVPAISSGGNWAPVAYSCSCAWGIQTGATVLVCFEGGDANRPVVLGQIDQ